MSRFASLRRIAHVGAHPDVCGSRCAHRRADRRRSLQLLLTQLEGRTLPSSFTALTVSDLIADINAANQNGGTSSITLTAPTTSPYVLTAVDNTIDGPTGLPVITAHDNLTILGNGDTIDRSTAQNTPAFRLLHVGKSGSLTLENLTLQNGLAFGSGSSAEGGAVYNQGTTVLSSVTVQNNLAEGRDGANGGHNGQDAAGGGIWSNGSLTLENSTIIENNQALGGTGGRRYDGIAGTGGNGSGGGLYVASGTADITSSTLSSNTAQGGFGRLTYVRSTGGNGSGGGLGSVWH
jgi:hypothetical protein